MTETTKTKALIVGRHSPDLGSEAGNFEVVANEAITFALDQREVHDQIRGLEKKAAEVGAKAILLQNVPAVLAVALVSRAKVEGYFELNPIKWGVVISVPGERQAGVERKFAFDIGGMVDGAALAAEAIKFVNGRAQTRLEDAVLTVTVDPVTPFVFSHIEWL